MSDEKKDDWSDGKEVFPEQPPKKCEAVDCLDMFTPSGPWGERRCSRCRKEKRPYIEVTSPF